MLRTPLVMDKRVTKFRRFFPAGVLPTGEVRRDDLVQIYCDPPGLMTVRVRDIKKIRGYVKKTAKPTPVKKRVKKRFRSQL